MATINETAAVSGVTSRVDLAYDYKIDYLPMFDAWLHAPEQTIPNRVAQKRGKMAGSKSMAMVPTGAPTGVGARMENWKIPTHRPAVGQNPEIIARSFVLRSRISFEAQLASIAKGTAGAWTAAKSLEQELLRGQLSRQWIGNLIRGNFDVLGVVAVGAGSAVADTAVTITLQGRNARRSTAALGFAVGTSEQVPFTVGMPISLVRAAEGVSGDPANTQTLGTAGEAYVSAISQSDDDAPTLTITPPSGIAINTVFGSAIAVGDYLIPYASRRDVVVEETPTTAISDYAGMNGMYQFHTGSTVYAASMGLSKTSVSALNGNELVGSPAGTQRDFNKRLVGRVISRAFERSGKTPNRGICNPFMIDEIFKEDMNLQRYGEVMGEKGFNELAINWGGQKIGFDSDFLALPGCIEMVNDQFYGYFEQCELQSPDPGGQSRYVPDYLQSEDVAVKIGNVMCTRPFALGRIDDLTYNTLALT